MQHPFVKTESCFPTVKYKKGTFSLYIYILQICIHNKINSNTIIVFTNDLRTDFLACRKCPTNLENMTAKLNLLRLMPFACSCIVE